MIKLTRTVQTFGMLAVWTLIANEAHATHSKVHLVESSQEYVTEGFVEVHAPVAVVYATLTDYRHWPHLFSDVVQATVKSGNRDNALVRFESRVLGHEHTVKLTNQAGRLVRFHLTDGHMGTKLAGEFKLVPVAEGRMTKVRMRIFLETGGVFGWFVQDESLRSKRQQKILADLRDLKQQFEPRRVKYRKRKEG